MKRKTWRSVILLGLLLCTLPGCKGEKTAPLPEAYTVGDQSIAALVTVDAEGLKVTETPQEETGGVTYTYEGQDSFGALVEDYTTKLTEENGFAVVDETFCKQDAPDFMAPEGEVHLARTSAAGEGKLMSLLLNWRENTCTVTVEEQTGEISNRSAEGMTLMECIDYINSLPPAALGLPGTSMQEYLVYALDGTAMVDEVPCLRVNIYHNQTPEGTNDLVGMFLMTNDGQHIYRLDKEAGTVKEVKGKGV